jgi:hypothetical protein
MLSVFIEAGNSESEEYYFVPTTMTEVPGFCIAQQVSFVGGEGIVRSYKTEFGSWIYLVEMALGPEPDCGRVGAETMVFIDEADLCVA